MEPNDLSPQTERRPNTYAIISLVLAIAPIILGLLLIILLLLVSGGTLLGDVGGALWPVFLLLLLAILAIGLAADILAVIFGIIAIRRRKRLLSWLGIIIVAVEVLIYMVST